MKRCFVLICCLFFITAKSNAQYVNIPDSNFRSFLMGKYPSCFNGAGQMDTTCSKIFNESSLTLPFDTSKPILSIDVLQYFKRLKTFMMQSWVKNPLNNISKFPDSLESIHCVYNNLTKLPKLPETLLYLECTNCKIDSLPDLPLNLQGIKLENNKIKKMPKLPNSIKVLNCFGNEIDVLPKLPDSLLHLYCGFNKLTVLPKLPDSLKTLICYYNNLSSIPTLPKKIGTLYCEGNSSLVCLPWLPPSLVKVNFDSSRIHCSPNITKKIFFVSDSNGHSYNVSLPLCSPIIQSCSAFPQIQGQVFIDFNSNTKMDTTEYVKAFNILQLSNYNFSYTNYNGVFQLSADSLGTYTITATPPPFYNTVPASYTHNFTTYDTLVIDTFALQAAVLKDSISIKLTPINWAARAGRSYPYLVSYENVGTTVLSNAIIGLQYDNSLLSYDSSSNNTVANSGSNLSLNMGNLLPGQTGSFVAYFTVKTTAVLNSSFISIANISTNTVTATDTITTIVRGSYDPNDKQATPFLTTQQVGEGKYIDYTIRFQNTGTDTAFSVVIADTLDSKLQANQVQIIGSSHSCRTTIKDNIIFFEFLDILLPDSNINKVGSNGFVSFKIQPIASVASGTTIPNKAAIYFDYNSPVITKAANTIIQNPLPLKLLNFSAIAQKETDKILVYWNTANEVNTSHFIIEQSIDGIVFKAAAEVAAKGIGSNSYFYSIDKNKVMYVRLKMVDKNGQFTYSNTIKISSMVELLNGLIVLENPVKSQLKLNVISALLKNTTASLINTQGKIVKQFILHQGSQTIDINDFAAGVYYLKTKEGSRSVVVISSSIH